MLLTHPSFLHISNYCAAIAAIQMCNTHFVMAADALSLPFYGSYLDEQVFPCLCCLLACVC